MGKNNAYLGESKQKRLARFKNGSPIEIIETLLGSIYNYFNNEIEATISNPNYPQTILMILGIHSVALTIAHGFFGKDSEKGYRKFLQTYMDGTTSDTKFSLIAKEIHAWRNVIAHRWLNVVGHEIGYDYKMKQGWKKINGVIFINPRIYLEQYLRAFDTRNGGLLYKYSQILNTDQKLLDAKDRILSKYEDPAY